MTLRSSAMAALSLALVMVVVVATSVMSFFTFVAVAATSVLIMGGTGHPLSTPPDTIPYVQDYLTKAIGNFVAPASSATDPTGIPTGPYNAVGVITPEHDAPNYGDLTVRESVAQGLEALDGCIRSSVCDYNHDVGSAAPSPSDSFVVFGYSQSGVIAMLEKARLAAEYAEGEGPDVSFVVIGTGRPNGGLVARDTEGVVTLLLFGTPRDALITDPVPTDTQYETVDIALQYDAFADFPLNPLNLLAVMNAYAGVVSLHPNYGDHSLSEPGVVDQGRYGDTTYYLIPAPVLPLLKPLQQVPLVGAALADALDPALRVLVEAGYDRTTSPGQPTPFNLLYAPNPIALAVNLLVAIPTGLDNGFEVLFGTRPFGTTRPGPYGVGGPTVETVEFDSSDTNGLGSAKTEPVIDAKSRSVSDSEHVDGVSSESESSTDPGTEPEPDAPSVDSPTLAVSPRVRAESASVEPMTKSTGSQRIKPQRQSKSSNGTAKSVASSSGRGSRGGSSLDSGLQRKPRNLTSSSS